MSGPRKALPRGTSGVLGAAPLLYLTHPETGQLLRRRWRLVVVDGPDAGQTADVTAWTGLIGAAPAAVLVLTDDSASRYHAEVDLFAEGVRVRDLDSTNGIFSADGRAATQMFLHDKDHFRLGETTVRVEAREERVFEPALEAGSTDRLGELVAAAPVTRRLFARLRRVAQVRSTVLLIGPGGSGKSACAHAMHEASRRKSGPFVQVDLRDPSHLHEQFEAARGGTIFLDNVESMPRGAQAELLERLDNVPVGGRDLRVIASSTRALEKPLPIDPRLAARLSVVVLQVPQLKDRAEDIPALAELLLNQETQSHLQLGPRCLAILKAHSWPGHVSGLKRTLSKLRVPSAHEDGSWMKTLRTTFLEELLETHRGHITQASEALGISQFVLYGAISAHSVDLDDL